MRELKEDLRHCSFILTQRKLSSLQAELLLIMTWLFVQVSPLRQTPASLVSTTVAYYSIPLHRRSAACGMLVLVAPVYSAMMTFSGVHFKHFTELTATQVSDPCVQVRPTRLCLTYRIMYKLNKTSWVSESQQG